MTDKQIIIDGERMFKCVWCKYDFKESDANFILSENPNECVCSGCMTEWVDNLLWDFKRKEQECDQFKTENKELKKEIAFGNNGTLSDKIRAIVFKDLNKENNKLKQTLTEIKEVLQFYNNITIGTYKGNGIFELEVLNDNILGGKLIYCYDTNPAKKALQKISEVEDDR